MSYQTSLKSAVAKDPKYTTLLQPYRSLYETQELSQTSNELAHHEEDLVLFPSSPSTHCAKLCIEQCSAPKPSLRLSCQASRGQNLLCKNRKKTIFSPRDVTKLHHPIPEVCPLSVSWPTPFYDV